MWKICVKLTVPLRYSHFEIIFQLFVQLFSFFFFFCFFVFLNEKVDGQNSDDSVVHFEAVKKKEGRSGFWTSSLTTGDNVA